MNAYKILLIVAGLLAIGFLLCPVPPGKSRIDPERLLERTVEAQFTAQYRADRVYTGRFFGRSVRFGVCTDSPDVDAQIPSNDLLYVSPTPLDAR